MPVTSPIAPPLAGRVIVLAVGLPEEDERSLTKIAARDDLALRQVKTMAEALAYMPVPVVVCEITLPDGDWKTMLEESFHWSSPPRVIVTSPLADDALWAEVLNLGGYDVLAEPLQSEEVRRVLNLASHNWSDAQHEANEHTAAVAH